VNGAIKRLSIILKLVFPVNSLKTIVIQSLFEESVLICVVLWLWSSKVCVLKNKAFCMLLNYSKDH